MLYDKVRSALQTAVRWLLWILVGLLIAAFFGSMLYLRVWACQELHPNASVLICLLQP